MGHFPQKMNLPAQKNPIFLQKFTFLLTVLLKSKTWRPKKSIEIGTDTHFPAIYVPFPYKYKVASIIKQIWSVIPPQNILAAIAGR